MRQDSPLWRDLRDQKSPVGAWVAHIIIYTKPRAQLHIRFPHATNKHCSLCTKTPRSRTIVSLYPFWRKLYLFPSWHSPKCLTPPKIKKFLQYLDTPPWQTENLSYQREKGKTLTKKPLFQSINQSIYSSSSFSPSIHTGPTSSILHSQRNLPNLRQQITTNPTTTTTTTAYKLP